MVEGTDYVVNYTDNIAAGTASVTIEGINNYVGRRTKSFTISKLDLRDTNIVVEDRHFMTDGSAIKPLINVCSITEPKNINR